MPDKYLSKNEIVRTTGFAGTAMLCTTWSCFHRVGDVAESHVRNII